LSRGAPWGEKDKKWSFTPKALHNSIIGCRDV
jgi:hypothetical protein